MPQVRVIARIVAKVGREDELKAVLRGMIAPTHAEPGQKAYDLFQSDDPRRFYFVETWASQEAFDFHAATPHFQALGPAIEPLTEGPVELNFVVRLDNI